ncbi:YbaB/EbfC family nucleoid-associated protein [Micromonospora sp. NPDC005710]|uniref:YbaB/EbfC family nucleoid-associated protein n=1 Tax=Micromonospora sp. NPDC005710 TaxID=3157051 RepID=UPI0033DDF089
MTDFTEGPRGFDLMLSETRRQLAKMGAAAAAGATVPGTQSADTEPETVIGEGSEPGGWAQATVSAGRLRSLVVDPRLLREGSEAVCDKVIAAVNAAYADLGRRATSDLDAADTADVEQLTADLSRLQDESMRNMTMFTQALTSALERIQAQNR